MLEDQTIGIVRGYCEAHNLLRWSIEKRGVDPPHLSPISLLYGRCLEATDKEVLAVAGNHDGHRTQCLPISHSYKRATLMYWIITHTIFKIALYHKVDCLCCN